MKEQLEFSVNEEWQKFAKENHWASFILETAQDSNGVGYHRKKGSQIAYRKIEDGFECVECGSEIQVGSVAHPIWDGPFPMSDSVKCNYEQVPYCPIWDGPFPMSDSVKCNYEQVPYCPKCEKEPNFSGSPIQS